MGGVLCLGGGGHRVAVDARVKATVLLICLNPFRVTVIIEGVVLQQTHETSSVFIHKEVLFSFIANLNYKDTP